MRMKKYYLVLLLITCGCYAQAQSWSTVVTDSPTDGFVPGYADGSELEYYQDTIADSLWFLVSIDNMSSSIAADLGVNIMFNYPGGGSTFNFWGQDNVAAFHRLLSVWVTGSPPSAYAGTIGIADASGVGSSSYTNLHSNNLDIQVSMATKQVTIGMKRKHVFPDDAFTGNSLTAKVGAAVGSHVAWNDDLYSTSAEIDVIKPSTGGGGGGGGGGGSEEPPVGIDQVDDPQTRLVKVWDGNWLIESDRIESWEAWNLHGQRIELEVTRLGAGRLNVMAGSQIAAPFVVVIDTGRGHQAVIIPN